MFNVKNILGVIFLLLPTISFASVEAEGISKAECVEAFYHASTAIGMVRKESTLIGKHMYFNSLANRNFNRLNSYVSIIKTVENGESIILFSAFNIGLKETVEGEGLNIGLLTPFQVVYNVYDFVVFFPLYGLIEISWLNSQSVYFDIANILSSEDSTSESALALAKRTMSADIINSELDGGRRVLRLRAKKITENILALDISTLCRPGRSEIYEKIVHESIALLGGSKFMRLIHNGVSLVK